MQPGMTRRRMTLALGFLLPFGMGVAAAQAQQVNLDPALIATATAKAKEITKGLNLSGSIEVIGENGGYEGAITEATFKPFEDATGVKVKYTSTQDASVILARVRAGNPPDVAVIQQGVMANFVKQGKLVSLSGFMGDELKANFTPAVLDTASVDGQVYGVYQGFNPFMYWYNPQAYTGPKAGSSWQAVAKWTKASADAGTPVWCLAQQAGAASGFPGAQALETLFAKKYGPKLLREWGEGTLAWSSPQVTDAWKMFGVIASDKAVDGGDMGALSTSIATGYDGLVTDPPTCQAAIWGAWTAGLINASTNDVKPGVNLDFMPIPASNPKWASTEIFQAAVTVAFKNNDATKAFLKYLASTAEQTLLASADQWTVANLNVPPDTYKSKLLRKAAATYFGKDVDLAAGPNILLPQSVNEAFNKGIVAFMSDQSQLKSILKRIDAVVAQVK